MHLLAMSLSALCSLLSALCRYTRRSGHGRRRRGGGGRGRGGGGCVATMKTTRLRRLALVLAVAVAWRPGRSLAQAGDKNELVGAEHDGRP